MEPISYPTTIPAMLEHLLARLNGVVPDYELARKAELAVEINRRKKERRAVILGHNYMEPALFHSVPDFTGDSLYLSRVAARTEAEVIVFCGVRFMAETAKILSPQRLVLLPSAKGGCSLAASITAEEVRALKARYPEAPVVTYVNTYADVKAETDICCTSANGAAVVRALLAKGHQQIIFLPDEYLARNVAQETGMTFQLSSSAADPGPESSPVLVGWSGRCEVHEQFTVADIDAARSTFPGVKVLAHPECSPQVVEAADFSGSTTAMIEYVERATSGQLLLLTECSMGDNIVACHPQREILRLCQVRCPHMGEITLEETLEALRQDRYPVEIPADLQQRARAALDAMIGIG